VFILLLFNIIPSLELMVRQRTTQNLRNLQVDTFKNMTDKQLAKLAAVCKTHAFTTGELIFSEGDKADNFYILVQGQVNIYVKEGGTGEDKLVKELFPGYYFVSQMFKILFISLCLINYYLLGRNCSCLKYSPYRNCLCSRGWIRPDI
jgi:hypothetical protein